MKTPEQWADELVPGHNELSLIQQIQLEAYKAGMQEAAQICEDQKGSYVRDPDEHFGSIYDPPSQYDCRNAINKKAKYKRKLSYAKI